MKHEYCTPGIPDEEFHREPGVPMTKNEIRILSLARLQLFPGAVLYDIGAGSGSISIEAGRSMPEVRVYAIEREARAVELIRKNSAKFGVELQLIEGVAPQALELLPAADRIFIGGSGGHLEGIIQAGDRQLLPGGRMVVNSVSLFNGPRAFQLMEQLGYQVEAFQVNIAFSRKKGGVLLWEARNPVTIISGQKGDA